MTNHIRQVGSSAAKYLRHHDSRSAEKIQVHGLLIIFFLLGAIAGTIFGELFSYRSIWGTAIVLIIIFIRLAYADRSYERELLTKVPHGHW